MSMAVALPEILRARGIPHRRMEDWKYSDLRQVIDLDDLSRDGVAVVEVALPQGAERADEIVPAWARPRLEALIELSVMDRAAQAYDVQHSAIRIPAGAHLATPLRLTCRGLGSVHVTVVLEKDASLSLVEVQDPAKGRLRNVALTFVLEEGARLVHLRSAGFADAALIETVSVVQAACSSYTARLLGRGAKLSRTEFNIVLDGEGAEAEISGICVLADGAHADITTRVDHAAPNTSSRQLFKKVAAGKSRAVYQGRITVREGAIGSDSRQTAKALLLSDQAEADLKPELEILADDVKCAHGAAVGDLDRDSLFYLRARGIGEAEARALLVHAFLEEVIDQIADDDAREAALAFVDEGLRAAMETAP